MDVGAPAVVAAIHDATGVWIHELPASPERILAALTGAAPSSARARRLAAKSRRSEDPAHRGPARPAATRCRCARRPTRETRTDDLRVHRQRRAGRARGAGHAPAARRPARGPRADRHQGGLRRGRVRRLLGPRRRRSRRLLPCACLPGRGARRYDGRGPGAAGHARTRCSRPSSRPAARSAASARRACSWPGDAFLDAPAATRRTRTSARRSPATCAAAPATPRSSTPSRTPQHERPPRHDR